MNVINFNLCEYIKIVLLIVSALGAIQVSYAYDHGKPRNKRHKILKVMDK